MTTAPKTFERDGLTWKLVRKDYYEAREPSPEGFDRIAVLEQGKKCCWWAVFDGNAFPFRIGMEGAGEDAFNEVAMTLLVLKARDMGISTPLSRQQLEVENRSLRAVLKNLVNLYVQNKGTVHEFISCITPKSACEMSTEERIKDSIWSVWDRARALLEKK